MLKVKEKIASLTPTKINPAKKIKELHPDIERYLKDDFCNPGEICSPDGLTSQIIDAEDRCELIVNCESFVVGKRNSHLFIFRKSEEKSTTGIKEMIYDAIVIDATENNVQLIKYVAAGATESKQHFDAFNDNMWKLGIRRMYSISDVMEPEKVFSAKKYMQSGELNNIMDKGRRERMRLTVLETDGKEVKWWWIYRAYCVDLKERRETYSVAPKFTVHKNRWRMYKPKHPIDWVYAWLLRFESYISRAR